MGTPDLIRVIVADDNLVVRLGLVHILNQASGIEVVESVADGHQAVAACERHQPDVAVLDYEMPGLTGVEATQQMPEGVRVLIVSAHDHPSVATAAIASGAWGYLVHGAFGVDEIIHAVRTVAAKGSYLSPTVAAHVLHQVGNLAEAPNLSHRRSSPASRLTRREAEVMGYVSQGLGNQAIADKLVLSEKTVKNYVSRIYQKLGVNDRAGAVATWLGTAATTGS